jgi:hypothetical protein
MKLDEVMMEAEVEGELMSDTRLDTITMLGALHPDVNYPSSPGALRVFSDRYDVLIPNALADAINECCISFGWAKELDFEGYTDARSEIDVMAETTSPCALLRSPCELWRERGPRAERWMTLQPTTLNRAAAVQIVNVASGTQHFTEEESALLLAHWRWFSASGGCQLVIVRQWECSSPRVPSRRRVLVDLRQSGESSSTGLQFAR